MHDENEDDIKISEEQWARLFDWVKPAMMRNRLRRFVNKLLKG